jgi:hypothetical protein
MDRFEAPGGVAAVDGRLRGVYLLRARRVARGKSHDSGGQSSKATQRREDAVKTTSSITTSRCLCVNTYETPKN